MLEAWELRKAEYLKRLEEDRRRGRLDPDIVDLLELLNSKPEYYTTSSCSGRIQVKACRLPGDKFEMVVVAKWHRPVEAWEVEAVLNFSDEPDIWLSVQPPILHVACRDLSSALRLLALARNAGFKHSGIQGVREDRVMVEITASERMEAPLRLSRVLAMRGEALVELVERANELLLRGKEKLWRLKRALSSDPPIH